MQVAARLEMPKPSRNAASYSPRDRDRIGRGTGVAASGSSGPRRAVGLARHCSAFLVVLVHVVGIAVNQAVRSWTPPGLLDRAPESTELKVHALHARDDRLVDAGVADHVPVGVVEADEGVLA